MNRLGGGSDGGSPQPGCRLRSGWPRRLGFSNHRGGHWERDRFRWDHLDCRHRDRDGFRQFGGLSAHFGRLTAKVVDFLEEPINVACWLGLGFVRRRNFDCPAPPHRLFFLIADQVENDPDDQGGNNDQSSPVHEFLDA
jgi:hypothetical protein